MENSKKWFSFVFPDGWLDVFIRAIMVAIVAFVVLQLQEFLDVGGFDTPAAANDSGLIAGGILVLNVILLLLKPPQKTV